MLTDEGRSALFSTREIDVAAVVDAAIARYIKDERQ